MVGATPRAGAVGNAVFRNVLAGGFTGTVYPVHPSATSVLGVRAYRTVTEIPDPVDLAVVAIPAAAVPGVARQCAAKGVAALLVLSGGFRETGPAGAALEQELRDVARGSGMRLVGPNCLGVINAHPDVRLNASFSPVTAPYGPTAIMTQSGAVGIAVLQHARSVGLGVSRFVSLGNKTDVSGNDLLELWESEEDVGQIVMYLESFGNPRRFVEIARRVGRRKPILLLKSGRTPGGARAAASHTGALAEADLVVDALVEQCGIVRVATIEELFDTARAVVAQPLPKGNRVGIVTNSGGPAIMAADALAPLGLALSEPPVDLLAGGGADAYEREIGRMMRDETTDAVLAIYTTPLVTDEASVATAIAASRSARKPLLAVFLAENADSPGPLVLRAAGVPTYAFVENPVRVLAHMHRLARRREHLDESPPALEVDLEGARSLLARAKDAWLPAADAFALLAAYGIPCAAHVFATSAEDAARAADGLGYPVVLKAEAEGLVHKSEAGGVALGLADAPAVRAAYAATQRAVAAAGFAWRGALVMRQLSDGHEVLVGGLQDPKFGPIVVFGLGGVYTEVLKDTALRLGPLTDHDADAMVRSIRAWPLLEGARGRPKADAAALRDVVQRVARLVADLPEVREVDLNPVLARPDGAIAVDARVRVAH